MRAPLTRAAALSLLLFGWFAVSAHAQDAAQAREVRWNVRTELLVVALPQEKAMALLPDLRDESKVNAAHTQLLAAVQRKEARLIGNPLTYTISGQKETAETIFEKIYPTQWEPPLEPQSFGGATHTPGEMVRRSALPSAFEKRNAGLSLEVEPTVIDAGKNIVLTLQCQHVVFDGMDEYEFSKAKEVILKVEQPRFHANRDNVAMAVHHGQWVLIGVHKSLRNEEMELHLIQVLATPVLPETSAPGTPDQKSSTL